MEIPHQIFALKREVHGHVLTNYF